MVIDIEDFILIKKIQSGDTAAAADVTQNVFLKLLEHIQTVRSVGKIQNYLLTIAVNTCNNYFKKATPIYIDLEEFEMIDKSGGPCEKAVQAEIKEEIRQAISSLPDYQKDVIILRFYHDLKIREIAQITGVSISTVKSRLQQGLKKLQGYLAEFGGGA